MPAKSKGPPGSGKRDTKADSIVPSEDTISLPPLWPSGDGIESSEYFNPTDAKSFKEAKNVMWPWQDPEGTTWVPTSIAEEHQIKWVRAEELQSISEGEVRVLASSRQDLVDFQKYVPDSEEAWLRKKELAYPPKKVHRTADLVVANAHLLCSEILRTIIAHLSELQQDRNPNSPHSHHPWDLIWPRTQSADGTIPMYNPSGKYAVKLYWMGAWRKILVDDTLPTLNGEEVLYPLSSLHELWPALITKAICKIAWMYQNERPHGCEFGECELLQILTGWAAERVPLSTAARDNVSITRSVLHGACPRLVVDEPKPIAEIEAMLKAAAKPPSPKGRKGKDKKGGRSSPTGERTEEEVQKATKAAERSASLLYVNATLRHIKRESAPTFSRPSTARSSRAASARGRDALSAITIDNDVDDFKGTFGGDEVWGIDERFQTPVKKLFDGDSIGTGYYSIRVVECIYLPTALHGAEADPYDTDGWILRCQSPLIAFFGSLAYDNAAAWTSPMTVACGISCEAQLLRQQSAFTAAASGEPYSAIEWHMTLAEFFSVAKTIALHHKIDACVTKSLEMLKCGRSGMIRDPSANEENEKPPDPKHASAQVLDLSAGQPYYFCYDCQDPCQIVVSLCVSPAHPPKGSNSVRRSLDLVDSNPASAKTNDSSSSKDDKLIVSNEKVLSKDATMECAGIIFECYDWKTAATMKHALELRTTGDVSSTLSVPAGKNFYRLVANIAGTYTISIFVPKDFTGIAVLRDEHTAWSFLSQYSVRLQIMANDACKTLDAIFAALSDPGAEPSSVVNRLALLTGVLGGGVDDAVVFLKALRSAMALTYDSTQIRNSSPESAPYQFYDQNRHYLRCGLVWHRVIARLIEIADRELGRKLVPQVSIMDDSDEAKPVRGDSAKQELVALAQESDSAELQHIREHSAEKRKAQVIKHDGSLTVSSSMEDLSGAEVLHSAKHPRPPKHPMKQGPGSGHRKHRKHSIHSAKHENHGQSGDKDGAATKIQAMYRKRLARKQLKAIREAQMLKDHEFFIESWKNVYDKNSLDLGVLLFRRYTEAAGQRASHLSFAADDKLHGTYKQLLGTFDEQPPGKWFILFKDILHFKSCTTMALSLRMALSDEFVNAQEVPVEDYFELLIVNNDTMEFVPSLFGRPIPHSFGPNKSGYTIMAAGQTPFALPQIDWGLRVISTPALSLISEHRLKSESDLSRHEKVGPMIPITINGSGAKEIDTITGETIFKYDVLFRFAITVFGDESYPPSPQCCRFRLSCNGKEFPDAVLELELSKNDKVLAKASGKHAAEFKLVKLEGSTPPPDEEAGSVKSPKAKAASRKSTTGDAKSRSREGSAAQLPVEDLPKEPITNSYILRGRVVSGWVPPPASPPTEKQDDKDNDSRPRTGKRPNTGRPPTGGKGKGSKRQSASPSVESVRSWTLEAFPEVDMRIQECRTRVDEIQEYKAGWEAVQQGRSERARVLRESFLTGVEPPVAKDINNNTHEDEGDGEHDIEGDSNARADSPRRTSPTKENKPRIQPGEPKILQPPDSIAVDVISDTVRDMRDDERRQTLRNYKRMLSAKRERQQASNLRRSHVKHSLSKRLGNVHRNKAQSNAAVVDFRKAFRDRKINEDVSATKLHDMHGSAIAAEQEVRLAVSN